MNNLCYRWQKTACLFGAPSKVVDHLYRKIETAYSDSKRHYHNLSHLEFMFAEIDKHSIDDTSVEFATWYHDFVYKTGSPSNEKESADIANSALTKLCVPSNTVDKVANMILATQDHSCNSDDEITALFLDIDMSILGSDWSIYKPYADSIHKEAGRLPDIAYRKARLDFLYSLEEREFIFLTGTFRNCYEESARSNIGKEKILLQA